MSTTPATRKRNDPQNVLKPLEDNIKKPEGAFITVSQHMTGSEIIVAISAISSFLQSFGVDDEYYIDIGLVSMRTASREPGDQNGK